MKIYLLIFSLFIFLFALPFLSNVQADTFVVPPQKVWLPDPSSCTGSPIQLGDTLKLLPLPKIVSQTDNTPNDYFGRLNRCITPTKIIMHATASTGSSTTNASIYDLFAEGNGGGEGQGAGSHFVIDRQGHVLQMVQMYPNKVEIAFGIAYYNEETISIEMINTGGDIMYANGPVGSDPNGDNNVADPPKAQYDAALKLVQKLMKQYNIPVGSLGYSWTTKSLNDNQYNCLSIADNNTRIACENQNRTEATSGVYGHYQLNTNRGDPGFGFMNSFIADLDKSNPSPDSSLSDSGSSGSINCVITKIGDPGTSPSPTPPSGCNQTGSSNGPVSSNKIVQIAETIKKAYDTCEGGSTEDNNGGTEYYDCLKNHLDGFNDSQVENFLTRRQHSLINNSCPILGTECLGFVGEVLAVLTGDTDAFLSGYYSPQDILNKGDSVTVGSATFTKVTGSGPLIDLQAGDLAVSSGHIAIVNTNSPAGSAIFKAIQSNYNVNGVGPCMVTDDFDQMPKSDYTYYRLQ